MLRRKGRRSGNHCCVVALRARCAMSIESRPETRNVLGAPLRDALLAPASVRALLAFCFFEVAYYFAYRYGMSFSQTTASPFWFPDSVLLYALLRTRTRWWWLLLVATVPIRFFSEVAADVSIGLLVNTALNDYCKAVVGALVLRRFMDDPTRFGSLRDLGVYCLVAVLTIPAMSALAGALARGPGPEYWDHWQNWFFGNALTHLVVTPFLFYWTIRPRDKPALSTAQWLEAIALVAGLVASLAIAFQPAAHDVGFPDSRLFVPVAILFWAAVRFGMRGATAGTAILASFAIAEMSSANSTYFREAATTTVSALQQFLLLRAAPLFLVAALLEQSRRIQCSLHESERRFRDMADSAPVMIWIAGRDGRCEFFNKGWIDFTGRTPSQERDDGWLQSIHDDDRDHCLAIYRSSVAARCEFELDYRLRRSDGIYRWILNRGVPRYGDTGEFAGFIGSAIDVTDRRRQETALRLSEERYRAVVDSQTELVCRFTPDLTLTFVNEAYCRFLGKLRSEVLGSKLSMYLPADSQVQLMTAVSQAVSGVSPGEWQCEVTGSDGSRVWQHWSCRAIDGAGDMPAELQAIGHDITDRKRADEVQRRFAHTA